MMALFARWRLRTAVGMLAVGLLVGVASRVLDGDPAKGIHVRWHAEVTDAERLRLEAQFLLRGERREDRTFGYDLLDDARANIQALVAHPAVEDTHHIDRGNFTFAASAEFGESRTGWAWRWGVERQLPWAAGLLLLSGSILLVPWPILKRWCRVAMVGVQREFALVTGGLWTGIAAVGSGLGSRRATPAFMRRDERLIVLVAAPLQLLVLYMVPLVFECDARAYY